MLNSKKQSIAVKKAAENIIKKYGATLKMLEKYDKNGSSNSTSVVNARQLRAALRKTQPIF